MPSLTAIKVPLTVAVFTVKHQLGITVIPEKMKPRFMTSAFWSRQTESLTVMA